MKLDPQKFALAAAITVGLWSILCTVFAVIWPEFALRLSAWLIHFIAMDKYLADFGVTFWGAIIGFAQAVAYTYVIALVFALVYNKLLSGKESVK